MLELKLNHVNKRGPRCVNVIEELAVHVTVLQRKLGIKEALKVAIDVPIKKINQHSTERGEKEEAFTGHLHSKNINRLNFR